MQVDSFSQIMYYLDSFFRWFAPYARTILQFISENINPYVSKIAVVLEQIANQLPDDPTYYMITMISLIVLGIVFNKYFEKGT